MLKNYLLVGFRNLLKHKLFSLINIMGLAIGMAASILILKYIFYESSYENKNINSDNAYRLVVERYQNGIKQFESARSYPAFYRLVLDNIPEIENCARVYPEDCMFRYDGKKLSGQSVLWADNSFLKIFNVQLLKRNSNSPLGNTFTTVISEAASKRLFGNEDPLGKIIVLNEGIRFIVNGVFKDYQVNSHIKFDFILSMNTLGVLENEELINTQYYNWLYNYVTLKNNTLYKETEKRINKLIESRFGYLKDDNSKIICTLQPIKAIHLKSNLSEEISPNSDIQIIYYLSIITAIILFMAWINYINLSTARALERGSEVGIRKVVGADKNQIITQFIIESLLIDFIALISAVLISSVLSSLIKNYSTMNNLYLNYSEFGFWFFLLFAFLMCGVAAGLYPAIILSSFKPNLTIKGKFRNTKGGLFIRRFLVVFQFTSAIVLITCTLIVYKQIEYVKSQKLGFSTSQVLIVNTPRSLINNPDRVRLFEYYKEQLLKNSNIKSVSAADNIPGKEIVNHLENYTKYGGQQQSVSYSACNIDRDYFNLLKIKFIAGRSFLQEYPSDSNAVIINNEAKMLLGFESEENVIGKRIINLSNNSIYNVIGIVDNYHQEDLKKKIEPIIYFKGHNYQFGYFVFKISTNNLNNTINEINNKWDEVYPDDPFDYFFLDVFFDAQYNADRQFGQIVLIFSLIAIIIALLGLFGLSFLTAIQKTKEIGIRKTLGASVINIVYTLSKEFLAIVLIAIIVSLPFVFYIMDNWLNTFTVRIKLNVWLFLIPSFVIVVVAMLTISIQIIKVAKANPIDSLRYE